MPTPTPNSEESSKSLKLKRKPANYRVELGCDQGGRCADSRLRNRNVPKLAISDAPVSGVLAPIGRSALLLQGDDGVVEAEHALLLRVGSNAGVVQGGVLIAAEGEDCLVHVDGVEDPEIHQQVEVSHR